MPRRPLARPSSDRRIPPGDLFAPAPAESDSSAAPAPSEEIPPGWIQHRAGTWSKAPYLIEVSVSRFTTPSRIFWTYWKKPVGLTVGMNGAATLHEAAALCEQHRRAQTQGEFDVC